MKSNRCILYKRQKRIPTCILCKHRNASTRWLLCDECDGRLTDLDAYPQDALIITSGVKLNRRNVVASHTLGVFISAGVVEDTTGLQRKNLRNKRSK